MVEIITGILYTQEDMEAAGFHYEGDMMSLQIWRRGDQNLMMQLGEDGLRLSYMIMNSSGPRVDRIIPRFN